jgi:hypothetical protein
LAAALRKQPFLVSAMVRVAILGNMGIQTFWEGWIADRWSDQQLEEFQKLLEPVDLVSDVATSWYGGELAGMDTYVEQYIHRMDKLFSLGSGNDWKGAGFGWIARLAPAGWHYQNLVVHNRIMLELGKVFDTAHSRVVPEQMERGAKLLDQTVNSHSPYKYLAAIGIPNVLKATENMSRNQNALHQARLVCALERYRRVQGQYPEKLEALVPRYIRQVPPDVLAGVSLRYQRTDDGRFLLYSLGWNRKDDGGTPNASIEKGDWVWPYPPRN